MSLRLLTFSILVTAASAVMLPTSGLAANPQQDPSAPDLVSLTQGLKTFASTHNVTLESIKFSRNIDAGSKIGKAPVATTCTAATSFDRPAGTAITLSITAADCTHAVRMLKQSIAATKDQS